MKNKKSIWRTALGILLVVAVLLGQQWLDQNSATPVSASSSATSAQSEAQPQSLPQSEAQPEAQSTPESTSVAPTPDVTSTPNEPQTLDENGSYTTKDDVALYLHLYGELPGNFITKKQAEALGWPGGNLEPYAPGKCIGGSNFGNYEGLLPAKSGRKYTECDIDTLGAKSRGAKRIVFSNDGLIYYTDDHYESFTLLYGEE